MTTMNIYDMADTWNAAGTTFTAIKMNVTDTASAAGSKLLDLLVDDASVFSVGKDGSIFGISDADPFTVRWAYANLENAGSIFMGAAGPDAGTADSAATGFGYQTLAAHTAGGGCTAFGFRALQNDTNGTDHTAFGDRALNSNNGGVGCSAFGKFSLFSNQAGGNNSGFGDSTLYANATGVQNCAFGYTTLDGITSGSYNSAFGAAAGAALTGGASSNVMLGYKAGDHASQKADATNTIAIGANSYTTADNQTVIGNSSTTQSLLFGELLVGGVSDTVIFSDVGGALGLRRPGAAQAFYVYNTRTDASNYERGRFAWASNQLFIGTEFAGTGTDRPIVFMTGGSALRFRQGASYRWQIDTSGHLIGEADNTYDIGASGANRPRSGYFGTSVVAPRFYLTELSADPSDPAEGQSVMWQSDGTGAGDDGDIMMKITAGGVTKTVTLVDFSAVG